MKRWTKEEIARLREHWPRGDLSEMEALFPGKRLNSIKHKAFRLRIKSLRKTAWSPTEILILKSLWGKQRKREIDAKLNRRTPASIFNKARELGLMRKRGPKSTWTRNEIGVLVTLWPCASPEEIIKAIPAHPWSSMQQKAGQLGVKRKWRGALAPKASKMPLIAALRKRRLELKMHATELAERMGNPIGNIRNWELAVSTPKFRNLLNWCEALGVELVIQPKQITD